MAHCHCGASFCALERLGDLKRRDKKARLYRHAFLRDAYKYRRGVIQKSICRAIAGARTRRGWLNSKRDKKNSKEDWGDDVPAKRVTRDQSRMLAKRTSACCKMAHLT
jgi:hypothetical protein